MNEKLNELVGEFDDLQGEFAQICKELNEPVLDDLWDKYLEWYYKLEKIVEDK